MNIEKNIPIPDKKSQTGTVVVIRSMEIGDSVVLNYEQHARWRSAAKHCGAKIIVRKISDTECRIWRIK